MARSAVSPEAGVGVREGSIPRRRAALGHKGWR